MQFPLHWTEVALRIIATLLACAALGLDRDESGKPAGLRTVALVGLVGALSMIAANLLLPTEGKTDASFVQLDFMRLPLGVLTGVGFIGAGAIIKHERSVEGLTTAATLWLATMVGILFGAGLWSVAAASAGVGFLVLATAKHVEARVGGRGRGVFRLVANENAAFPSPRHGQASFVLTRYARSDQQVVAEYEVIWNAREDFNPRELVSATLAAGAKSAEFEMGS